METTFNLFTLISLQFYEDGNNFFEAGSFCPLIFGIRELLLFWFRVSLLLLHLHKTAFGILRSCVPSCYTKVPQRRLRENSETCLAHYYSR